MSGYDELNDNQKRVIKIGGLVLVVLVILLNLHVI